MDSKNGTSPVEPPDKGTFTAFQHNKIDRRIALVQSTIALAASFAVWTIFSIIGIKIKQELHLSETQFGLLLSTPILTGSIGHLFVGIFSDKFGGRIIFFFLMLISSLCTFLLSYAHSYYLLLFIALGLGLSGSAFISGASYVSNWYPKEKQGTVLGLFSMGNVGAAITQFFAPLLMIALGWEGVAKTWSSILFIIAIMFLLTTKKDPHFRENASLRKAVSFTKILAPLKKIQVWRFAIYYFFTFGGFVALSLWLPRYYMGVYDLDIKMAGIFGAAFSLPAGLLRALGGWLSDKYGARKVLYWTFTLCVIIAFLLSYPNTDFAVQGFKRIIHFNINIQLAPFIILNSILGFLMALGMAAVFKHIPVYYPDNIGSVGGFVGMIGGLGGFLLPIIFGFLNDIVGIWTSCFMVLFAIALTALLWMHLAILALNKEKNL